MLLCRYDINQKACLALFLPSDFRQKNMRIIRSPFFRAGVVSSTGMQLMSLTSFFLGTPSIRHSQTDDRAQYKAGQVEQQGNCAGVFCP